MLDPTPADQHDGTRYSTAHTEMREALGGWQRFKEDIANRAFNLYGDLNPEFVRWENDPNEMRKFIREIIHFTKILVSVLERLHWPRYDQARSLLSDERAFEQAARHLRNGHPELAWGLVFSALTHADEWRNNTYYKSLGIDLRDYFQAEANLTLQVIQRHHLALLKDKHDG